ncbi:hypothetical protein BT96DRAFT_1004739 [Gymnopus androsaceus JB14]|uniref:Ricin B lectin domain-containing protein n=1 Tax=Gymnopus androsaceus JB14 TaxID=1447944 RepID=A0A6A4GPY6_9AGAR|nr:hypothetical protein BT96DRAFT_1004739 [Gymnopus androsaceus JB14]
MFSLRTALSILACTSLLLKVHADIPPSPGPYTISNANDGLVLNLDGPNADSTYNAREFQFNVPYHSFVQQRWTFTENGESSSGSLVGGNGVNQGVTFPPLWLACSPTAGAICNAVTAASSDTDWVLQPVTGGYVIASAQDESLVLTGPGVSQEQVSLSNFEFGNLQQVWVFAGYTTTGCACCVCGVE